jgi:hypothetical protein
MRLQVPGKTATRKENLSWEYQILQKISCKFLVGAWRAKPSHESDHQFLYIPPRKFLVGLPLTYSRFDHSPSFFIRLYLLKSATPT